MSALLYSVLYISKQTTKKLRHFDCVISVKISTNSSQRRKDFHKLLKKTWLKSREHIAAQAFISKLLLPPFELVQQQTKFKFENESVNQVRNFGRCCWVTFKMRKAVSKFCFFMMMVVTGHSRSLFRNMLG